MVIIVFHFVAKIVKPLYKKNMKSLRFRPLLEGVRCLKVSASIRLILQIFGSRKQVWIKIICSLFGDVGCLRLFEVFTESW